jgi:hypothetical protein
MSVACGENFTLVLRSNATVSAWGVNDAGQLGDGSTFDRSTPAVVSGLTGISAIAAGRSFSLALTADGHVYAWGRNNKGQLGNGSYTSASTPALISGLSSVVQIAAGEDHALALKSDGTIWGWGGNDAGELGSVTAIPGNRPSPVQLAGFPSANRIAASANTSYSVLSNGSVCAWGEGSSGQIGNGLTADVVSATTVAGVTNIAYLFAGGDTCFAVSQPCCYAGWAPSHFTTEELNNPAISGPMADPDDDGVSNLFEFLAQSDPRVGGSSSRALELITGGTALQLQFTALDDPENVTIQWQYSTNLTDWISFAPATLSIEKLDDMSTRCINMKEEKPELKNCYYRLRITY